MIKKEQESLKKVLEYISKNYERITRENAISGELIENAVLRGVSLSFKEAAERLDDINSTRSKEGN